MSFKWDWVNLSVKPSATTPKEELRAIFEDREWGIDEYDGWLICEAVELFDYETVAEDSERYPDVVFELMQHITYPPTDKEPENGFSVQTTFLNGKIIKVEGSKDI